ncbi:glycine betaine ABC transporter substrate-binding protein [Ancylobacter sp. FA202]|uniref:glycine betaine ABC transporter substrate-binding protein n=1 Tax=Ancylobacter sp. FA202 TaxID=1111106 RepID=UPI001FDABFBF|nr:glycine betaine ABC transporter substrate-binding protein [Ancylobacter sp. FA202]
MDKMIACFVGLCVAAMPLFASAADVKLGAKGFTENILAGEITQQYLASKGIGATLTSGLGSNVVRQGLVSGQIDLYWEYTGPALVNYHKMPGIPRAQMLAKLNELDATNGLEWLDSSDVNDTYALAVRRETAKARGLRTTSDLAAAVNRGEKITFGCNAEFYGRKDGLMPMQEAYGFSFPRADIVRMDSGLVYQALRDGQVDVGLVFSTDGRIPAFDFVLLEDDRQYHIAQVMTPVATKAALEAHPQLKPLLKDISSRLNEEVMARLNAQVDVEKKTISEVANGFLKSSGLVN